MEVEKFLYLNKLFDVYKELLTDKQKNILSMYIEEDLSLGEIGKELGISRQGVYDSIKKSEQILYSMEDKIGYLKRENYLIKQIKKIDHILNSNKIDNNIKNKLIQICEDII